MSILIFSTTHIIPTRAHHETNEKLQANPPTLYPELSPFLLRVDVRQNQFPSIVPPPISPASRRCLIQEVAEVLLTTLFLILLPHVEI